MGIFDFLSSDKQFMNFMKMARESLATNNLPKALEAVQRARKIKPSSEEAYKLYADICARDINHPFNKISIALSLFFLPKFFSQEENLAKKIWMQDVTTFYPNGSVEHADGTFLELAQDPKTNMVIIVTPTQYKLKIMKHVPSLPWLGQDQEAWETVLKVEQPTLEALLATLTQMVSRNQFVRVNNDLIFRVDTSESG